MTVPTTNLGPFTVFWSWQADSSPKTNRNFVEDCLKRAAKRITASEGVVVSVDRDTDGVGGTPAIADTILRKIRSADIFVWDGTLVYGKPRPAPNPNVMVELGYALAVLGEGRLVGVMNTSSNAGPKSLPFDLTHRRWPIPFSLATPSWVAETLGKRFPSRMKGFIDRRATERERLTTELERAIRAALLEPRLGILNADVDLHASRTLWNSINSEWVRNWREERGNYPQYESRKVIDVLQSYGRLAEQPENRFLNEGLRDRHSEFVGALGHYLKTTAREMVGSTAAGMYELSVRAAGAAEWSETYDARYEAQVQQIESAVDAIWVAWGRYVEELRTRFPEVTASPSRSDA